MRRFYFLIIMFTGLFFLTNCSGSPEFTYNREIFISSDYTFNGGRLNRPMVVRKNQDNEVIVLDVGNGSLYVFDDSGRFIRKIGQPKEGPGFLRTPVSFEVDTDGDIYVYELGNKKMSIFSKDGTFINAFEVSGSYRPVFSVTEDKKILMNIERDGYFITVLSRDGEIEKEIGSIREYVGKDLELNNMIYFEGIPFMNNEGNYCIYVTSMGRMLIFNEDGNLVQERLLDNIPDITVKDQYLLTPEKIAENPREPFWYFYDIMVQNDKIYFIIDDIQALQNKEYAVSVYVMDIEFNVIKKMYLPLQKHFFYKSNDVIRLSITSNEDEIYCALGDPSEVLRFTYKQNE